MRTNAIGRGMVSSLAFTNGKILYKRKTLKNKVDWRKNNGKLCCKTVGPRPLLRLIFAALLSLSLFNEMPAPRTENKWKTEKWKSIAPLPYATSYLQIDSERIVVYKVHSYMRWENISLFPCRSITLRSLSKHKFVRPSAAIPI